MKKIVPLNQCIEDIVKHTEKQEHIENQIRTIIRIADEWKFSLHAPHSFIDGLKTEAKHHESRIERVKIYIAKHYGEKNND